MVCVVEPAEPQKDSLSDGVVLLLLFLGCRCILHEAGPAADALIAALLSGLRSCGWPLSLSVSACLARPSVSVHLSFCACTPVLFEGRSDF